MILSQNPARIMFPYDGAFEMSPVLREVIGADPVGNPWAGFDVATALARAGIPVLPCEPGGKEPLTIGPFRRGASSATTDVEAVRDVWLSVPDANLAIAPDGSFVVADVDVRHGGSLEALEALGLPLAGYRERSGGGGWHVPLMMPRGTLATRSVTLAPGVEIKARGSYVVSPHSHLDAGGWYGPEPGRDVWTWLPIPAGLSWLHRLTEPRTTATYDAHLFTAKDRDAARQLVEKMGQSTDFGTGIAALLAHDPDWARHFPTATDTTESGRDLQIALAASHFLRDEDRAFEITAATVARCSAKAARHRQPAQYAAIVATAAIIERDHRDAARLHRIRSCIQRGLSLDVPGDVTRSTGHNRRPFFRPDLSPDPILPTAGSPSPTAPTSPPTMPYATTVIDATSVQGMDTGAALMAFVLGSEAGSEWSGDAGWVRVPVLDCARLLRCSRETIRRHVKRLEAEGVIETQVHRKRHDGAVRADRWVRLMRP